MDEPQPTDLDAFAQNYNIANAVPQMPPKASKGNSFDFASIVVQSDDDFARLPDSQKQLLRNMKQGIQYTPQAAAEFVESFNTRIAEQSTPQAKAQAQSANLSAQKTKLDIEKLEKEKIAAAKDSAEVATRKQLIFDKIDKYTNPQNPKYTPLNALVGKWDGTAGALLDASGVNDQRAAQRTELDRLVSSDILELTKFLKPIAGTDLEFLRSMVPKIHQNDTIWTDYLTDSKKVLEAMTAAPAATQQGGPAASQQAAPQPAAAPVKMIGNRKFVLQPNGKYVESR